MLDTLHLWLDAISVQQDYFWFLSAIAWVAVGVTALRKKYRAQSKLWLVLLAAVQALVALAEVAHFVVVPQNPSLPSRGWEWVAWLGVIGSASAFGWRIGGRMAWIAGSLAAIGVVVQMSWPLRLGMPWPVYAGLFATLVLALCAWGTVRRERQDGTLGRLAICVLLGAVLSPNGPLADMANEARRWAELSVFCIPAAVCQLLGAVWARGVVESGQISEVWLARDRRQTHLHLAIWLAAGFVFAVVSGALAKRAFERSLLSRAQAYAYAVDIRTLETWLDAEFRIGEALWGKNYAGRPMKVYRVPAIESDTVRPLREFVDRVVSREKDVLYAHISVLRDDEIVLAVFRRTRERNRPEIVLRYGMATDRDQVYWTSQIAHVLPPATGPRGPMVQAKAPLVGRNGAMLGWLSLDTSVAHWAAAQAQARLQLLAVVCLGAGFLLLADRHRRRTDEKDAAVQAAAIAKAADTAKGTFLAQVSHELRTPIQSILGYGELLQGSSLTSQQKRWMEAQEAHGEQLLRLVNDLLDTMALQSGTFRLEARPGNIVRAVEDATESLRMKAQASGVALRYHGSDHGTELLVFDPTRVKQVVHNLVGNAIKFAPRGVVEVTIATERMADARCRCQLAVKDSGPGISPEDQVKLFQPFVRLPGVKQEEGMGLGLAISRRLCRAMEGDLTVESALGAGAQFTALWEFPCASQVEAPSSSASPGLALLGQRLLVADDNAIVRELFIETLRYQGAEVTAVGDGCDAVTAIEAAKFDALVLDLSLPGLDGTEVARRLREKGHALRIVGVSAHADRRDHDRALEAGMDCFLPKPVSLAALVAALRAGGDVPVVAESATLQELRLRLRDGFLASGQDLWRVLGDLYAKRDWSGLAQRAHHLKGSADMLAFVELSRASASLYAAAEIASEAAAAESLAEIRRCFDLLSPSGQPV